MDIGAKRRWARFINRAHGHTLMVPLDHGLTMGPLKGMESYSALRGWLNHPDIDAVIVHKGLLKFLVDNNLANYSAVCMHINGTSNLSLDTSDKPLLVNIETAMRYGADAVSIDLMFSPGNTARNFSLLGKVIQEADSQGIPVLVMLNIDADGYNGADKVELQRRYMRSMCELGVTAVKLKKPDNLEALKATLDGLCNDINIVFAGGDKCDEASVTRMASNAVNSGAQGICIGRNVFQDPNPAQFIHKLKSALFIHEAVENSLRVEV